ncbi:MAG: insulinase family protein [Psychromonas sp.]|nr:insulinase family protein [Psychromonas sp.]
MKRLLSWMSFLILFFNLSINSLSSCLINGQSSYKDSEEKIYPLPKGVSIYQLDNGMEVLLIENSALPMVGVNVFVKVGSAYETFATSGMSHMLEHLLFNGTESMNQKELYDAVDKIGGYNNAHTDNYYTDYMMVTPDDKIFKGMEVQSDMLFRSVLPQDKFEKEKGIVMEEIAKSLSDSREQAERNIISIIYKGHALSLPTLGTYETIKNMNRDDVYAFYKNYYRPNNMIMSVIGNFKKEEMLSKIKGYYGGITPGDVTLPENPGWATGFEKQKSNLNLQEKVFYRFYDGQQLLVNLIYQIPGNPTQEFLALLGQSIGIKKDTLQSMLDEKFPEAVKQIDFQIRSNPIQNYLETALKIDDMNKLNDIIDKFNSELQNLNLSLPPEIINSEAVKTRTNFYMNVEKPHMFGIYNASTIAENGIESVFESYSKEGYNSAGKMLINFSVDSDPIIIIQQPKETEEDKMTTGKVKIDLFAGSGNKPTIITKQNSNSKLLAIHYLMKNKAAFESKYGKDASQIWHDAFGQRMKLLEIQNECTEYGLRFTVNDNPYIPMDNIYLSPAFGYIRVEGLSENIAGVIKFLNNQMLNFIPTEAEFEKAVKNFQNISMMKKENKANQLFDESVKNSIYTEEKYPEPENEINYDNLLKFGAEYFNPQNMIISVVSPAESNEINNYFSNFSLQTDFRAITEPAYQRSYNSLNEPKTIEDSLGSEQAYLFYGYILPVEKQDKISLHALSLLLSDKIIFDVREKQGMAYRMSAGINIIGDKALFSINMGTRPENVEKLIPQFPGFFTTDYTKSFNEEDLEKSINMYLGKMMFRRLSSINQAYYLGHSYYFDGDINADREELNEMKKVTFDDVKRVADKYLHVSNPVKVIIK